jgi:hypothetical protein
MFLGNLPPELGELKLLQLMQVFGMVKALVIHKGPDGSLKPFGHAEYVDPSVTDVAIQALNQLGEGLQLKTGEVPGGLQIWLTGVGYFGSGVGDLRRGGAINILQA